MASSVLDLSSYRFGCRRASALTHPAGIRVPFDDPLDFELIAPQIRNEISTGRYSRDMIGLLADSLGPGDRVLVIGAGLGILAALAAKSGLARRVIAIEADARLIPYIERLKVLNGAGMVEVVHGTPGHGRVGSAPLFTGPDLRDSSLTPVEGRWTAARRVPFLDMNLILAEERISLIVCDVPEIASHLLAESDLSAVDRILVRMPDRSASFWLEAGLFAGLASRGYHASPRPADQCAAVFRRAEHGLARPPRSCGGASIGAAALGTGPRLVAN